MLRDDFSERINRVIRGFAVLHGVQLVCASPARYRGSNVQNGNSVRNEVTGGEFDVRAKT